MNRTFLELINDVLTRLREDSVGAAAVIANTDVYVRLIGALVNDAKDWVEDAWQWSGLRGTDLIQVTAGQIQTELPVSADNNYIIRRMYSSDQYFDVTTNVPRLLRMHQVSVEAIRRRYQGGTDSIEEGMPQEFAVVGRNPATNNLLATLFPTPDVDQTLTVDRVSHQPRLVNPDDVLLVPSLPVYSYATALASRERGELGGTPTSELFAIAQNHLSDAVAQDSALFASEIDWYGGNDRPERTNFRFA